MSEARRSRRPNSGGRPKRHSGQRPARKDPLHGQDGAVDLLTNEQSGYGSDKSKIRLVCEVARQYLGRVDGHCSDFCCFRDAPHRFLARTCLVVGSSGNLYPAPAPFPSAQTGSNCTYTFVPRQDELLRIERSRVSNDPRCRNISDFVPWRFPHIWSGCSIRGYLPKTTGVLAEFK